MTCSQNEQEHDGRCCMKCSKGTYVSNHCKQKPNDTQCAKCSHGFYTENSNYIDKCLTCRTCYANHHLQISKPCTTESNTKCKCMEGFYCTGTYDDHCVECKPITRCPPGQGVSVPSNSTHDTVCEPCPQGTFNNKNDYITQCRNHTSCLDLRRHFISHGTAKTDAQCGDFESRCHWMIPASLWAGLILTLILVVIGGVCLKYKRKRKGVITLVSSENFIPPALPPDVIKYPRSPELQLQTLTHNNKLCAEEDDGDLTCDGASVNMFSEKCGTFSIPDTCMSFISEHYRSEPQEDDWPGL